MGVSVLETKLNVKSVFKIESEDNEKFIELFNYKLLKIILYLEEQIYSKNIENEL